PPPSDPHQPLPDNTIWTITTPPTTIQLGNPIPLHWIHEMAKKWKAQIKDDKEMKGCDDGFELLPQLAQETQKTQKS
nr:hypothetical protein [Tanacetum cinerariifolium]